MPRKEWVRCPTAWVREDQGLRKFTFTGDGGAHHTAALMCLTAILHVADQDTGVARLNYDQLERMTGRSRTLIAEGLRVLGQQGLIRPTGKRSTYALERYEPSGWGKFPLKSLYQGEAVEFFDECRLRTRTELDALKLLFLFVALRSEDSNLAKVSYDRINDYTGISRENIKRGTSLLATHGIVFTEHAVSEVNEYGVANAYRIRGIDSRRNRGTRGRRDITSGSSLLDAAMSGGYGDDL